MPLKIAFQMDPARAFSALLALAREGRLVALVAAHTMGLARRMDRVLALENGTLRAGAA